MSSNKYKPHILVIPEDDANRQMAVGFKNHDSVNSRALELRPIAGGWGNVLDVFEKEYVQQLRDSKYVHVIMLLDFDDDLDRLAHCSKKIPPDLRERVFVIGAKLEPENLKTDLGMSLEKIGNVLAESCFQNNLERWNHPHLQHNAIELDRLVKTVKPILFR